MKKVDILYLPLIEEVSNLCDNDSRMEEHWNGLSNDDKEIFDSLTEALSAEKRKLAKCKRECEIYDQYQELRHKLIDFNNKFSSYPDFNISKINYIITISEAVFQNSSVIPDEDVLLELSHDKVDHGFNALAYVTEVSDLDKTVVWFSPTSNESVNELVGYSTNINCWYALLHSVNEIDFNDCGELMFYSKVHSDSGISSKNISALLKMHMTSSGLSTVNSIEYTRLPSNSSLDNYCPTQSYLQFSDVIGILGEYNNRKEVLSKYLSIFHIIENFMFKEPIVALERVSSGDMFSIRDFKRLYKSVDLDEKKAVKNLFKKAFDLPFGSAQFKNFAFRAWENFLQRHSADEGAINSFLSSLAINDMGQVNQGNFFDFVSRVVYQIRCSIVHNKETEIHISSENYPTGCKVLLEDFLFLFLEELTFLLMSKENSLVWYSSNSIQLWSESA